GPGNVRRIGKRFLQFRHQWAVRAVFKTGRQNGRQLEIFGKIGKGEHVVLELVRIEISYQRQQAGLVIYEKNSNVILVEAYIWLGHRRFLSGSQRLDRHPYTRVTVGISGMNESYLSNEKRKRL